MRNIRRFLSDEQRRKDDYRLIIDECQNRDSSGISQHEENEKVRKIKKEEKE